MVGVLTVLVKPPPDRGFKDQQAINRGLRTMWFGSPAGQRGALCVACHTWHCVASTLLPPRRLSSGQNPGGRHKSPWRGTEENGQAERSK